ncbi:MAG: hypothetical protein GXP48_10780, partial [Acidobacteria bacterium]|nr:hypothetical protein [Acidobacteriota bacterium]
LLYQWFIEGPFKAGKPIVPAAFFGGVMAMGILSVIGLALYGKFVAPEKSRQDSVAS